MYRTRGLNELAELKLCECQIMSCHVTQMRDIPQCFSSIGANEGRRLLASPASSGVRTSGSRGVSTGLQSHIPKVRNTRSAYPACTVLPVLAALSRITLHPRYSLTSPSSCVYYCRTYFICPLKSSEEFLLKFAHNCSRLVANQAVIDVVET